MVEIEQKTTTPKPASVVNDLEQGAGPLSRRAPRTRLQRGTSAAEA